MNSAIRKLKAENWTVPGPPSHSQQLWTGDFRSLRLRLYLFMLAVDCSLMAAAFLMANFARFGRPFDAYGLNALALLLPIYLATSLNGGSFSIKSLIEPRRSVRIAVHRSCFLASQPPCSFAQGR